MDQKINILIEGGDVNPHFAEGTKNIIITHAKELSKRGHNVVILTRRKSKVTNIKHSKKYLEVDGIKFYRWDNYVDLFFRYGQIIKKEKIDLIHIFSKGLRPYFYIKILKGLMKKPIIFSSVGFPYSKIYNKNRFIKLIRKVDLMIMTSKYIFDEIKEIREENCIYLPYGVDLDIFKKREKRNNSKESKRIKKIIYLRIPSASLLNAFKKIKDEIKDVRFSFNKSLIEKSTRLKNFIDKNGDNIEIIPLLKNTSELFNNSDIVIDIHNNKKYLECASPPLLILEAMACETIVISTNMGEISEFIEDNKNGFLVKNNGSEEIVFTIKKALNAKKSVGKNARKTILEKYDIKKLILKYEEIYKRLIRYQK